MLGPSVREYMSLRLLLPLEKGSGPDGPGPLLSFCPMAPRWRRALAARGAYNVGSGPAPSQDDLKPSPDGSSWNISIDSFYRQIVQKKYVKCDLQADISDL